ncbi:hypothetical protein [Gorillibacterium sp. sgz5001074]|uniref:hypothetical protein n=1 Tax=Gorillibacterium sp. sgz5001074 TaxID=3446695 RepID=UPI003F679D01
MVRNLYRAHCGNPAEALRFLKDREPSIRTRMTEAGVPILSLHQWEEQLFLYYEAAGKPVAPAELLEGLETSLLVWPGTQEERRWVPLIDIFHYQRPVEAADWSRMGPKEPYARVARLKPEQAASYIFYHYQLQEERPGIGNKYGMIGMHENLLFFYSERPEVVEKPAYEGILRTANTPGDWPSLMEPHFILWEEAPGERKIWLDIPCLLAIQAEGAGMAERERTR